MNNRSVVLVACGYLSLIGRAANAQQPLTLAAAQAEARAHAPDVAQLDAAVHGAELIAADGRRRTRQNPELATSYTPGAPVGRSPEVSWNLGVAMPVDVSGSWKPRAASGDADLARARYEREDGLRILDERVADAVAEVALQQRLVARSEQVLTLQQIAADAAHRQLDRGLGTELEADSADLDLAAARASTEQTKGDLLRTQVQLARLLGYTSVPALVVADPVEPTDLGPEPAFENLIDHDPRVRALVAELDAAKFELEMFDRLVNPMPTFGVAFGYQRRDIPVGSFSGVPFANNLAALWPDRELTFSVSLPMPFFDRQQEPRARAAGRIAAAEAKLRVAQADVWTELTSAWSDLQAAARALIAVGPMSATIDRDVNFVDQAVRAGAFDAVQRTQALRRLVEAGRLADTTVRDFRMARATWIRLNVQ